MRGKYRKFLPLIVVVMLVAAAFLLYTLTDAKFLFLDKEKTVDHVLTTVVPEIRQIEGDISFPFHIGDADYDNGYQTLLTPQGEPVSADLQVASYRTEGDELVESTNLQLHVSMPLQVRDGKLIVVSPFPFPQDLSDFFYTQMDMGLNEVNLLSQRFVPAIDGMTITVAGEKIDPAETLVAPYANVANWPEGAFSCIWYFCEDDELVKKLVAENAAVTVTFDHLYVMEYDLGLFIGMALG